MAGGGDGGYMAVQPPSGVLVIRVWWEQAQPPALRARLLVADSAHEAPAVYATAAGLHDVCEIVRGWLEQWGDNAAARDEGV